MINQLVSKVFCTRNAAHIEHWLIKSGYNHETLGEFYDGVIDKIDSIVESYIGIFGPFKFDKKMPCETSDDIIKTLEADLIWINQNRKAITRNIPAIDNLVQELEQVYMTALFKLRTKE